MNVDDKILNLKDCPIFKSLYKHWNLLFPFMYHTHELPHFNDIQNVNLFYLNKLFLPHLEMMMKHVRLIFIPSNSSSNNEKTQLSHPVSDEAIASKYSPNNRNDHSDLYNQSIHFFTLNGLLHQAKALYPTGELHLHIIPYVYDTHPRSSMWKVLLSDRPQHEFQSSSLPHTGSC